jgi:hypothetical protein
MLQHEPEPEFHMIIEQTMRFGEEPSGERKEALITMAARNIRNLSRTGAKIDVIEKWVMDNFPQPEEMVEFIQNIPTAVITLISSGVISFRFPQAATEVQIRTDVSSECP